MSMTILRPGSIVVLKTRIEGGVSYSRTDLAAESEGTGAAIERWETVKVTDDPEEHARAVKVRGKASNIIARICSKTAFGLLCSSQREGSLASAIDEARELIAASNATFNCTRLYLYVLQARIAETEGEAARAIASELRDILATMQEGIASADAVLVRKAANKAKQLGGMLDASAGAIVTRAIDEARAMVAAFNGTANCTRLYLYVLQARIAETEGEAARAIASELRDILGTMQEGISTADVALVRKAANKAKQLGGMLDASAAGIVTKAIDEARAVAKEIVKRAKDQGDAVAAYIDTVDLKAISEARFAFLDMEAPIAPTGDALPAVDARGLDLDGDLADGDLADGDLADGDAYQARGLDLDGESGAPVAMVADSVGVKYEV